jgi:hypothetical protein
VIPKPMENKRDVVYVCIPGGVGGVHIGVRARGEVGIEVGATAASQRHWLRWPRVLQLRGTPSRRHSFLPFTLNFYLFNLFTATYGYKRFVEVFHVY